MPASDYQLALQQGFQVGDYRIERVLGKGGFGITYLAVDLRSKTKVAIKELLPDGIATRHASFRVVPHSPGQADDFAWALERFREEARILAELRHPNIVRVHRLIEANETVYMVMDFLGYRDLGTALREHATPPDPAWLLRIFDGILTGLEAVHQQGQLHRDLKPANIMVTDEGTPILLDFGSARADLGRTITMTSVVTEGYSPFEQYQTRARQGPFTDIYAAAAVMHRALTGRKPLVSTDRMTDDRLKSLAGNAKLKAAGYPKKFLGAIDQALKLNPDDRPESVAAWRKKMGFLKPGSDPKSTKTAPPVTADGRGLKFALIATVSALIIVSGLALFHWFGPGFGQSEADKLLTRAEAALENGDFEDAIQLSEAALTIEPGRADAEAAWERAQQEIEIQQLLNQAEDATDRGDWHGVIRIAGEISEKNPNLEIIEELREKARIGLVSAAMIGHAERRLKERNFSEAKSISTGILDSDPTHVRAREILEIAERELKIAPLLIAMNEAYQSRDLDEAESLGNQILALDPNHQQTKVLLVTIAGMRDSGAKVALAKAALIKEDFSTAAKTLEEILATNSGHAEAKSLLATALRGQIAQELLSQAQSKLNAGDFAEAEKQIRESITRSKLKAADGLLRKAVAGKTRLEGLEALADHELFPGAHDLWEKALNEFPDLPEALDLRTATIGLVGIRLFENGEGDHRDFEGFYEAIDELAELDAPGYEAYRDRAISWRGYMKLEGQGTALDFAGGNADLESVKDRNSLAMTELGYRYLVGLDRPEDEARGVEMVKKGAAMGDAWGQELLARLYRTGIGVPQDSARADQLEKSAFEVCRKRGEKGEWYFQIARIYGLAYGIGTTRDRDAARKIAQELRGDGCRTAASYLGWEAYQDRDFDKAAGLFEEAADAGSLQASCALADLYFTGDHPEGEDQAKSVDLLKAAADARYHFALESLASLYVPDFEGNAGDWNAAVGGPDAKKAAELFEEAFRLQSGYSASQIGELYQNGTHPEGKNPEKARMWIRRGVLLGDNTSIWLWAIAHNPAAAEIYRLPGLPVDAKTAVRFFEIAASQDHHSSIRWLANMYEYGDHPEGKNVWKAYERYKQAAELGDTVSMNEVAWFFYPEDVVRNEAVGGAHAGTAFKWFEKAWEAGDTQGAMGMADLYLSGHLPEGSNFVEGMRYLTTAAEAGDAFAMSNLASCYAPPFNEETRMISAGIGGPNISLAVQWMERSIAAGDSYGIYLKGISYEDGWNPEGQSNRKALEWYRKALNAGYAGAQYEIDRLE